MCIIMRKKMSRLQGFLKEDEINSSETNLESLPNGKRVLSVSRIWLCWRGKGDTDVDVSQVQQNLSIMGFRALALKPPHVNHTSCH